MFVDGFDGILARWLDVKKYATWIDGGLMDNIIDFVNYVVVAPIADFTANTTSIYEGERS